MPLVRVGPNPDALDRRSVDKVLGIPETGPSARGSTYWGRVMHCGFEHYLGGVLGWHSVYPDDPLDTGIAWHYALEVYYLNAQAWQAQCLAQDPGLDRNDTHFLRCHDPGGQYAAFQAMLPLSEEPGYESIWKNIEPMLDVYFARNTYDRWEILGVEATVESLRYGIEWSNKLDLIVIEYTPDMVYLRSVEHKSSYRLDSNILEGYTQDLQTLGQVWLVKNELDLRAYPPYVGSYVNVTSKGSKPKCGRTRLQPSQAHLDSWELALRQWHALRGAYEQLSYPKNYAACTRRYGRCEFFNFCRNNPHLGATEAAAIPSDDMPDGYAKRRLPVIGEG